MLSFVKKHHRTMFTSERMRFAIWAGLLMWVIIGAQYCIYFIASGNPGHIPHHIGRFMGEFRTHPIGGPILMAIVAAFQFGMLYFATVLFGQQALRKHAPKAKLPE
jgi:hypothetical protein